MSIRSRTSQCLGKQLPDKPHSRPSNSTSRWPGHRVRWHEEQNSSKSIQTSGSPAASVASERIFRSRETVKAWLESSPTSVLEDIDDESPPSSFESFNSSPSGSDHLSYTTRFHNSNRNTTRPAHSRSRTISPPRCTANRNSVDLSRIDADHYNGGSFLVLAFKNAQHRGTASPPAFQYTDDPVENFNVEECGSPKSEYSLTSEWQFMLAAGNAAGMSTRDSSANPSEIETPCEVLNVSDLDLNVSDSDMSNLLGAHAQEGRKKPCRTRSMELPRVARIHDRSASGELKDMFMDDKQIHAGVIYEQTSLQRLSRRNSEISTAMQEAFERAQKQEVRSIAAALEEVKGPKFSNRYQREERDIKSWEDHQRAKVTPTMKEAELKLEANRARLMEKSQDDKLLARRKAEEKKSMAEAKRAEKAARAVMEGKSSRRAGKVPRGCLFG